jgi:hypothetical protein
MKILVIDSHKGTNKLEQNNLHWKNAKIISDELNSNFIWSYPEVNDNIHSDYDVIILVHASNYSYVDYEWIKRSPKAKLFYVTNEINLGEPSILWKAVKDNRNYNVIANHPAEASKIVKKYVLKWNIINLNSLIYDVQILKTNVCSDFIDFGESKNILYYGSWREDRKPSYKQYLSNDKIKISTHLKNRNKFFLCTQHKNFIDRIDWNLTGLKSFDSSIYIEDDKTHKYYNFLANRFYEGLNYNCTSLFADSCKNTLNMCEYNIPSDYVIGSSEEALEKSNMKILPEWHIKAQEEKEQCLYDLKNILFN